jgi:hypothetical protein
MKKFGAGLAALSVAAATLLSVVAGAGAASASSLNLPAGYRMVVSGLFTATNGQQSHGFVTCPGTKVPASGGAEVFASSTAVDMNSSYPSGQSWAVDVNNTSGSDHVFEVWAVCITHVTSYTVVSVSTPEGGMSTQFASVACPTHTAVVGGGVFSSSASTGVNINSTVPDQLAHGVTEWTAAMANATTTTPSYTVYAVCRSKPFGYTLLYEDPATLLPGAQDQSEANCPTEQSPIGGGGFTNYQTTDTQLAMSSTYPYTTGWSVYGTNGGSITRSVEAAVICVGP